MDTDFNEGKVAYGCIFCKTGDECDLAKELSKSINDVEFIVARKASRRRINGEMHEETVIMFPGYVFFRVNGTVDLVSFQRNSSVLKILSNEFGQWQLLGDDYIFADWLFSQGGIIGFSHAIVVDDRLRILKGPLIGYEGQIVKINRRFQNCLVSIQFNGREFKIWLSYKIHEDDSTSL